MAQEIRQPGFTVPAGATDLWLIRHGESEPAVEGRSFPLKDGHGDPALHPNGQKQALAVGARLSMTRFDTLYVTSLRRTHQTAAPLAAAQGLEPVEVADLREVFLGDWEGGLFRFKAAQNDPAYLRARSEGEWGHIPGAETTNALRARISGALESIHQAHKDQRVAAVVHGGVIASIMEMASGARPGAFQGAANGSISRVLLSGSGTKVVTFNDCTHLD